MSMPPQRALLADDVEPIREVLVRLDRALGYHPCPVSPAIQLLLHSMPMDSYSMGRLLDDMNDHRVSFRGLYLWAWQLPVHHNNQRVVAQVI